MSGKIGSQMSLAVRIRSHIEYTHTHTHTKKKKKKKIHNNKTQNHYVLDKFSTVSFLTKMIGVERIAAVADTRNS